VRGALNLFSDDLDAFTQEERPDAIAAILAAHAAPALSAALNTKLAEVARRLVDERRLPEPD
jgi:hypothetical protein